MPRTALVSGGGTGVGHALAERFAAAGDRAVVTGRREEALRASAEQLGDRAAYVAADLREPGGRRVADFLAEEHGGVDIAAACAAGHVTAQITQVGGGVPVGR